MPSVAPGLAAPHRSPRWLRSVRRRPAAFVFLFVLSALAVVVSVLTPLLLRSTQAVVLAQTVAGASWLDAHVVATVQTSGPGTLAAAAAGVHDVDAALVTPGAWAPSVTGTESSEPATWQPRAGSATRVVYLSRVPSRCTGVTIQQGRCPAKRGEGLLAASTAASTGLGVGARIALDATGRSIGVTVVGLYDDRHGGGALLARPSALAGAGIVRPEPAIALDASIATAGSIDWTTWSATRLRNPLALTAIPGVRADLRRAAAQTLSPDNALVAGVVTTSIGDLLTRIETEQTSAAVIAGAIGLQALGLAWFALAAVIGRISRDRAPEWGIGRLRGVPRRTWLGAVFLEPTVAGVSGAVAGLAAGIGLAQAVARIGLGPTAVVDPSQPFVLACGALALLGSLVAIVAASVRSARLPLAALLRETTEPRQLSRVALVAQFGAVLLTGVVLWVVVTQQQTGVAQVGLLAPALVAVVIALAALRLTVMGVRRATSRPTRSLAGLVVGRQFARAPSVLASAVLVAVGAALTAYTLQVGLVADRAAVAQAAAATGAATVLRVAVPAGTDLIAAVHRADPGGRTAMAAAETTGSNLQATDRIVAVEASRLAAITTWRRQWRGPAGAALAARLDPPVGPDLVLTGTRLRLTLQHLALSGDALSQKGRPPLRLRAVVAAGQRWVTVQLGELRNGTIESAAGAFPCATGCRLVSISIADPAQTPPAPYGATFELAGIATDQQTASSLSTWTRDASRWRSRIATVGDPAMPATAKVGSSGSGLALDLEDTEGTNSPTIEPANGPDVLPAIAAADTRLQGFAGLPHVVSGSDLAQRLLLLRIAGTAPVLPRSLDDGVLVDLSQLHRITDPSLSDAVDEVWLAAGAHPAVQRRLADEGVRVTAASTLAGAIAANERRAPPRALRLSLVTALVAALLTLLGLVAARVTSLPGRLRDWRTLLRAGVSAGRLRGLATLDATGPPAVGALFGVLAGLVAYVVTVQRLPLAPSDVGNPPADWTPSFAALGLLGAAAVIAVAVIGLVGAAIEVRMAAR